MMEALGNVVFHAEIKNALCIYIRVSCMVHTYLTLEMYSRKEWTFSHAGNKHGLMNFWS